MTRTTMAGALAAVALLLAACANPQAVADSPEPDQPVSGPAQAMCAPDVPDCIDVVVGPDDQIDVDATREQAQALLGVAETDLPDDVRVARRGEETFALTEDYVLGRRTVELDAGPNGGYHVVAVTVELPEGPESFSR